MKMGDRAKGDEGENKKKDGKKLKWQGRIREKKSSDL